MDRSIFLSANGSNYLMSAQLANINNLANLNTPGFRADVPSFASQNIEGGGLQSRVFSTLQSQGADFTPGSIVPTGNQLDLAIDGDGWIAVQGSTGSEGYTRAGNLKLSAQGFLLTQDGQRVLGNGGPISIPASEKIEIGKDGTISAKPLGQGADSLVQVDRIKLVKPEHKLLSRGLDGLFYRTDNASSTADPSVTIVPGAYEKSNVDAVGSLVNMIDFARQYEIHMKMMKLAEDNSDKSSQVMQVS